jgi:hypothetical protein
MACIPTAALNFMTTQTITAPAAASWTADVSMCPTPLYFGKVHTGDGVAFGESTVYNPSLGVALPATEFGAVAVAYNTAAIAAFHNNVQQYRLTYAAMTVTLTASATTNQGSVVAAQYPLLPQLANGMWYNMTSNPQLGNLTRPAQFWSDSRYSPQQLQAMPGSVQWEARKGVYSILKLDQDLQRWRSAEETFAPMSATNAYPLVNSVAFVGAGGMTDFNAAVAFTDESPAFGPYGLWSIPSGSGTGATSISAAPHLVSSCTYPPTSSNVSHAVFSGLDPLATLVVTFRVGYEVVVPPDSQYIGLVSSPINYDPVALQSYYKISREMLAGYPAEYNSLGSLATLIASVAKRVVPPIGRALFSLFNPSSPSIFDVAASNQAVNSQGMPSMQRLIQQPRPPRQRPSRPVQNSSRRQNNQNPPRPKR